MSITSPAPQASCPVHQDPAHPEHPDRRSVARALIRRRCGRRRQRAGSTVPRMALRLVFAEDNFLVREGTSALFAEVDEIDLVAAVGDPASLLKAVRELRPDAVLTDIRMPPTFSSEGIEAAKQIRAEFPTIGVVVLSQYAEDDLAFELLSDGVAGLGYLLKERVSQVDELVDEGEVNRRVMAVLAFLESSGPGRAR